MENCTPSLVLIHLLLSKIYLPLFDVQIEMMSEAIDETLDKDEAEEETEELTNQVNYQNCGLGFVAIYRSTQ